MAARTKTTLQFGPISLPVKIAKATETKPSMCNMCVGQPGHDSHAAIAVTAPKKCSACGEITDYTMLKKGIKEGSTVAAVVDQSVVAEAKAEYAKDYDVLNLVPHPAAEFLSATAPGESVNFLVPGDASVANQYQLLKQLIASHPESVFVSLYTPVSVTSLYVVRVRDDVLVMEQRVRTQDIKESPSVGGEVTEQMTKFLPVVEGIYDMTLTPYDAEAYEDKYAASLAEIVAKAEPVTLGATPDKPAVKSQSDADLLAKLQALVAS